jgi:hypothetical protein
MGSSMCEPHDPRPAIVSEVKESTATPYLEIGSALRSTASRLRSKLIRAAQLIAYGVGASRILERLPGARRVPLPSFVAMTAAGSAIWAAAFITTGALAGTAWVALSSILGRVLLGAALLIVALILVRRS